MALKSWSITNFDGDLPETKELLDSSTNTIILLSLLIANNSGEDVDITVERRGSDEVVKFTWMLEIPAGNSPVALDSKMVFESGDKLTVTSNKENVSVDASGDES